MSGRIILMSWAQRQDVASVLALAIPRHGQLVVGKRVPHLLSR